MDLHVRQQMSALSEGFIAVFTVKWFVLVVGSHVNLEGITQGETPGANFALVRFKP